MTGENISTKTWLPVFPGFYGTFFDGEGIYEQEIEYIHEEYDEDLAEVMESSLYTSKAGQKLWDDYQDSIARQCVQAIEKELSPEYVTSIKFEEISSPKFYNFSNDSINIIVEFSPANIQAIRHFISEHFEEWREYLKGTYTSCDGFMSHHSNVPGAEEWFVDNALTDSHNAGAVLEFICGEKDINTEFLYQVCEQQVSLDCEALKKECIEMGWYVPDTMLNRIKSFFSAKLPSYKKQIDSKGRQYIFDTAKQRYIFAITKEQVTNNSFIIKRFFKIFIFGRLKIEKGNNERKGNKN